MCPVDLNCGGVYTLLPAGCKLNASNRSGKRFRIHKARFCAAAKLVQVKRFRTAVWKKLKENNGCSRLNVME